jgi:hypothetical protein
VQLGTTIAAVVLPLAVLVLLVLMYRLQARPARQHPLNQPVAGVEVGSEELISDAGAIGWPSLLDAMTVPGEAAESGNGSDSNSVAERLGLLAPGAASRFQPNLIYGTRHGRQVFVRIGIDETYLPSLTTRHIRQITVVRAETPEFELVSKGGVLRADSEVPEALRSLLRGLHPSPEIWQEVVVVGGPEGIVATRPAPQRIRIRFQWLYDLWLLERIAESLQAPGLPTARLGQSYLIPYGLGRA